ncbi:MAG: TIGR03560 family F420-dependent LLM class oxidoreductase [Chloroflexota bacterium]|nr:TIGR03560 family F420-dependent LLM class oxidoreductase [Chloroflexota bacterium]
MRFGIVTDQNQAWPTLVERWRLFEALGFDSAWDCDHFIQPSRPTGPYLEAWTLLAALAAVTERIRIGVLVSCNTFRHPSLLAKEALTVDHVSNGRLELGLGAGWFEPEHPMFGIDMPAAGELVMRYREAVELIDGLLRNDTTSYAGQFYQVREAPMRPRPVQQPRPPFVLAAHKPKMLRIVARYADTWNSFGSVDEMRERNMILDEHCAEIGRDPRGIVRSLYGWAAMMPTDPWQSVDAFHEMVGRYAEAGVDEFLIDQPRPEQQAVFERIAADVLPALRKSSR